MTFEAQTCEDGDMPRAFELLSQAFGHDHPYIEACFPAHETEHGRRTGTERFLAMSKADPCATNIKVVDESGRMIGHARWIVCDGRLAPELELTGPYWKNDEERDFAVHMYEQYLSPRRKAIKESGGHIVCLDLMTVDPKHQRNGVGRVLLEWGLRIADRLGVEAVVEATAPGKGLYASAGFVSKYKYQCQLPEKWASRPTQHYWWMVRPSNNGIQ